MIIPGAMGVHENPDLYVHQPLGYSFFPKELAPIPPKWVATTGNLVFVRQHSSVSLKSWEAEASHIAFYPMKI
jgi:microsomal epoxide hydrolase